MAANHRERDAYLDAAASLRNAGYQVLEHNIGTASAQEVADQIAMVVLNLQKDRP